MSQYTEQKMGFLYNQLSLVIIYKIIIIRII